EPGEGRGKRDGPWATPFESSFESAGSGECAPEPPPLPGSGRTPPECGPGDPPTLRASLSSPDHRLVHLNLLGLPLRVLGKVLPEKCADDKPGHNKRNRRRNALHVLRPDPVVPFLAAHCQYPSRVHCSIASALRPASYAASRRSSTSGCRYVNGCSRRKDARRSRIGPFIPVPPPRSSRT